MHSPDLSQENIEKIRSLFPNCVTEAKDDSGKLKLAIDFDQLKQELSDSIVEGPQERYHLNWPGKREALLTANAPIAKTLRPCRDESVNFDTTENLFIEGDNLEALKLLQETYLGKVKMIYIDPPYNTGSDFIYDDDFAENSDGFLVKTNQKDELGNRLVTNKESNGRFHSDWLSFIFPRIKLAHKLLKEDGVIFISIDDNEFTNAKKVCDEVFGENNFIANVIWQRAFSPKNDAKYLSESHDFILIYAKDASSFEAGRLDRTAEANARYKNFDNDPRGVWISDNLTVKTYSEKYDYPITTPSGTIVNPSHGSCWRVSKEKFKQLVDDNRIWWGKGGSNVPRLKRFLSEVQGGMVATTIWEHKDVGHNQEGRQELKKLFDDKGYFDGPKPIRLIERIFTIANVKNDDIVLDFFAGSGTTGHAVLKRNQDKGEKLKFILVQLPEVCKEGSEAQKAGFKKISDITRDRIVRAGKKVSTENNGQSLDIGFRVLKIDSSNMTDVFYRPDQVDQTDMFAQLENIKENRTDEDLLFQVLLDWGVGLTLPITKQQIASKDVFFVNADEDGEGADLIACFATNISNELIKELAEKQPLRVVFRDDGFANDSVKINVEQIFKQVSPMTDVKSI